MENFKKEWNKKFIIFIAVAITFYVTAIVLLILNELNILIPVDNYAMSGIFSGCIGGGTSALVMGIYVKRTLKNEEKIKKAYVENTDERKLLIEKKAVYATSVALLAASLIGAVIFAYINLAITVSLIAVFVFFSITFVITTLYYNKKY